MEFIFLGTSSGTPTKKRNVSGVAVKKASSKSWFLVDCGEGTQHQILLTNLSLNNLQVIFITHVHGDHCYGLPGLLASATMSGRTDSLTIIGPSAIKEFVESTQKTTQMKLSYEINFIDIETISELIDVKEFDIEVVELSHRVLSFAYAFIEKNIKCKLNIGKLKKEGIQAGPVWGDLQDEKDVLLPNGKKLKSRDYLLEKRKPRKIIVSGDNDNPSLLADCAKQTNVLIHEATYTKEVADRVGKEPQHSSAKIVAQFAMDSSIANLVLTHFSPRYQGVYNNGASIEDIKREAMDYYNGNLFLANDLDVFSLDKNGKLVKIKQGRKV
ncbi:ribonuclease Z [Candidatus Parabeggiatoa sp. HSG14]|uniref:ribonuclease Z n=1 Tax=Candidatus Parabeggiatoa sp. HSG14 TaxID=3055593 RepID=UPI0025A82E65|nr:ribonuclease Z [Thiotrichales bacterium HSG14]